MSRKIVPVKRKESLQRVKNLRQRIGKSADDRWVVTPHIFQSINELSKQTDIIFRGCACLNEYDQCIQWISSAAAVYGAKRWLYAIHDNFDANKKTSPLMAHHAVLGGLAIWNCNRWGLKSTTIPTHIKASALAFGHDFQALFQSLR
jgi:hypothetical protein